MKGDFMDERKRIIVNEIKKWQKNKLLPETYCQFLLSLYSEGNNEGRGENFKGNSYSPHIKKAIVSFAMILILFITILFVIYFTQFSPASQVGVLVGFLGISLIAAFYYNRHKSPFAHVYVILSSFISFIITIAAADLFFPDESSYLAVAIVLLCLSWIVSGWRYRYHYLYIAGGTGILLFIGLFLVDRILFYY
ncbi:hypothetical protein CR194_01625 [Salipaludibacillus keqinensis]|uniref:DUF2157 domain-containing protein n=2 Tax=Salipaludibacillus keqinensis TaxID=2045207 RepID=A0A323TJY4_9BACI|nr:hypothetical protein CR194_01625 [Salipaludibacillus keqinensis]